MRVGGAWCVGVVHGCGAWVGCVGVVQCLSSTGPPSTTAPQTGAVHPTDASNTWYNVPHAALLTPTSLHPRRPAHTHAAAPTPLCSHPRRCTHAALLTPTPLHPRLPLQTLQFLSCSVAQHTLNHYSSTFMHTHVRHTSFMHLYQNRLL